MYSHLIEYTWVYYIPLFGNCSEGELLCTEPSLSPLSLLRSNFGIDISNGLHELNVHEETLHLTGYMSSPYGGYNFKVALKSSFHSFLLFYFRPSWLEFSSVSFFSTFLLIVITQYCRPCSMSVSMPYVNG